MVATQELAQAHRIALGRRDEDDLLVAPRFQTFDERRQRNILAVERRILAQIAGQKRLDVQRRRLGLFRGGKQHQRFAVNGGKRLERCAPLMFVYV